MSRGKTVIAQEDIMSLLDSCYEKCLNGVPYVSPSVEEFAKDYLEKHHTPQQACKAMINNQIIKCTTSGFITGFGGIVTMPVSMKQGQVDSQIWILVDHIHEYLSHI